MDRFTGSHQMDVHVTEEGSVGREGDIMSSDTADQGVAGVGMLLANYTSKEGAASTYESLKRAMDAGQFYYEDAAVVSRDVDGTVSITEHGDMSTGKGAGIGALIGGVIGILGGPAGIAIGAGAGAAIGGVAAHSDAGFNNETLERIARTTYLPGERMQCDLWFPPADIPLGHGQVDSPPVLVLTAGYSRVLDAVMIPTRTAEDLIAGHWLLLNRFGVVPRELVWDQEDAVGAWRRGKPVLTQEFEAFRGMLGTSVRSCRARRPQAKGLVERNNGCYETSFLPGRVFTSPADFNTQISAWIESRAERASPSGVGLPADHPVGDRQGRDAAAASGRPGAGLAALGAHAPGPLRAHRCQRLLGRPAGDRPTGRGDRRPGPGCGDLRRAVGRRPPTLLGRAPEHHRSRPCRRRGRVAGGGSPGPAAGGSASGRGP